MDSKSVPQAEPAIARAPRGTGRRHHGAIAHKLGVAILSGEYQPGEVLAGELVKSEALDVSRPAYREAIQALIAKGLVESRPKKGTWVLPQERWHLLDPDVLAWAFAGEPDPQLVRHLYELRSIIEPAAAGLAAERRDHGDLEKLRDALLAMRTHTLSTEAGRAADRDFHAAILHATRNPVLIALSAGIGAAVSSTTQFKLRSPTPPRDAIPDHARVYEGIAASDAGMATAAMRDLVNLALADTNRALRGC